MSQSIVVVDDNPLICDLIEDILGEDYTVTACSNGEEAITYITEAYAGGITTDLVILDVQMPQTDGFETLRVLRDPDNGWPEMKVIMLTVRKEPENALKAWGIGADYYMTKPFAPEDLQELVAKVFAETSVP